MSNEMKTYLVFYGKSNFLLSYETEAENEHQAEMNFRKEYGYAHFEIQFVTEMEDQDEE